MRRLGSYADLYGAQLIRTLWSLVLLATLAPAVHAQSLASVTGTVRDGAGSPVRDAVVVVDPDSASRRTRTTADGRFRIDSVTPGEHFLLVARLGFRLAAVGIRPAARL